MPDPDYITITNSFVPGTDIESAEVNQNFTDVKDYIDTYVVKRNGSTAFTAIPSGPAVNPSSADQFTRKQYVDDQVTTLNGVDALRLQSVYGNAGLSGTPASPTQMKIACGSYSGTTNAFGCIDVPMNGGLSNIATVMVCNGDTLNTNALTMAVRATIPSQVTVQVFHVAISPSQVLTYNSLPVRVNWIAVGW